MAVHFILRSHYDEPSGKLLRHFDDATMLDWFRRIWGQFEEVDLAEQIYEVFGYYVDPFYDLFLAVIRDGLLVPETIGQLEEYLTTCLDPDATRILCGQHWLTIMFRDRVNMELCCYLFDDTYVAEHPDRVPFLLYEGWRLPGGHSEVGGFAPVEPIDEDLEGEEEGEGATYFATIFYDYENEGNLTEIWPPGRIQGIRLPKLVSYLTLRLERYSDVMLALLRSQLFNAPFTTDPLEDEFRKVLLDPATDRDAWVAQAEVALMAYSDWLQERQDRTAGLLFLALGLRALMKLPVPHLPSGLYWGDGFSPIGAVSRRIHEILDKGEVRPQYGNDPLGHDHFPLENRCCLHVEDHLAQLCLNTEHWRSHHRAELYHQWILFDDLWAAAHPEMANAILRYARCWDVLSPDGPHD